MDLFLKYRADLHYLLPQRDAVRASAKRLAAVALPLLREAADPRGRCNRQAFLHIALTFLAVQVAVPLALWMFGIEMGMSAAVLFNAPILWIGTAVCIKRLHDVGHRGWWIPGAFAIWGAGATVMSVIAGMLLGDMVEPGRPAFFMLVAAVMLPAFGALLWLHTAPSELGSNKFGPVPGRTGLSMPAGSAATPAAAFTDSVLA